jgi:NAD(P)H-hydrate epimerase
MRASMAYHDDKDVVSRFSSLVIGPGLSRRPEKIEQARRLLHAAIAINLPCVIDAEALTLLDDDLPTNPQSVLIATPHPGEAARILSCSASEIQNDRLGAIRRLMEHPANDRVELIWLLKGANPIVGTQKNSMVLCEGGVPALAIGGSGDVLAGSIGALIKQCDTPFQATLLGLSAHLASGRTLEKERIRGHFARDIADQMAITLFTEDLLSI